METDKVGAPLSDRELEILRLVTQGKANKEIASELFISINTVKVHLQNIFQKLEVASRTEATMIAFKQGLISTPTLNLDALNNEKASLPTINNGGINPSAKVKNKQKLSLILFTLLFFILGSVGLAWSQTRGTNEQVPNTVIEVLNKERWESLTPSPNARKNMAITSYEGKIYLFAGENSNGVTGLAEVYDISTNSWSLLPEKPTPVNEVKAAVLGGKIYLPGGITSENITTEIVEVYNPQTNEWSNAKSLPFAVANYSLISFEGQLFLFGGTDGNNSLVSVLTFNPYQNEWVKLPDLNTPTKNPFLFSQDSEIRLISKFEKNKNLGIVESNNLNTIIESQTGWHLVEKDISIPLEAETFQFDNSLYFLNFDEIWVYDFYQDEKILFAKFRELQNEEVVSIGVDNFVYFFSGDFERQKTNAGRFLITYNITLPFITK